MEVFMQEILFKGKLKDSQSKNQWVTGYYCKLSSTTYAFKEDYEKFPITYKHFIVTDEMTDWGLPNKFAFHEIEPESLGQYIGWMTPYEKIYTGDILRNIIDGKTYKVVWDDYDGYFFEALDKSCNAFFDDFTYEDNVLLTAEIIGNVND